ncbi:Txe/YoeB family addiction module toxin [Pleurocapsales cyanobacterium LEGE 10410]|nr:Txe/YoeB family addiction module toxin [Pleurocapsales cyanobacterium LEGE 10410]
MGGKPARIDCPIFTPTFREHLLWWAKKDSANSAITHGDAGSPCLALKVNKILDLVEVVCQQPFKGIGKPEPLKYVDSNIWSRRINLEHRLVYRIKDNRIYFLQCRYHYD